MADALEMPLSIPSELGPPAVVISELRERVRAAELDRAAERRRTGGRILGRRAVLAQSWREHPASCEPRRNLRPWVASRSKWMRIEALLRDRAFALEYAEARARWRDGHPAAFPNLARVIPSASGSPRSHQRDEIIPRPTAKCT